MQQPILDLLRQALTERGGTHDLKPGQYWQADFTKERT